MIRDRVGKRRHLIAALSTACILAFFGGVALAADYIGNGYFPWSYLFWEFGGPTSDSGGSYITPARNGMSSWDSKTDIDLEEVSDGSWDILVNVSDYGATGWTGQAYICNTAGDCATVAGTSATASTYSWCSARINTNLLFDDSQSRRQNTIMHEVGHCFSLHHRDEATSIMQPGQTTITTPNSKDISLINARY